MGDEYLREQLILYARKMNMIGINQGTSGNLSVRVPGGMLITPSSTNYEVLEPKDIVKIEFKDISKFQRKGQVKSKLKNPSSEWLLHKLILEKRSDMNAVLHCHSINATAIACLRKNIPSFHYMIAIAGGKDIKCAPYKTFGTEEFALSAVKALRGRYACLLSNHGQVAISSSLEKALTIALEVEILSDIFLKTFQIGKSPRLKKSEIKKILKKFQVLGYGNQ